MKGSKTLVKNCTTSKQYKLWSRCPSITKLTISSHNNNICTNPANWFILGADTKHNKHETLYNYGDLFTLLFMQELPHEYLAARIYHFAEVKTQISYIKCTLQMTKWWIIWYEVKLYLRHRYTQFKSSIFRSKKELIFSTAIYIIISSNIHISQLSLSHRGHNR